MEDDRYTAYSYEQEYLLIEGFNLYLLDIEHDFTIQNKHNSLQRFDKKVITIIYC